MSAPGGLGRSTAALMRLFVAHDASSPMSRTAIARRRWSRQRTSPAPATITQLSGNRPSGSKTCFATNVSGGRLISVMTSAQALSIPKGAGWRATATAPTTTRTSNPVPTAAVLLGWAGRYRFPFVRRSFAEGVSADIDQG